GLRLAGARPADRRLHPRDHLRRERLAGRRGGLRPAALPRPDFQANLAVVERLKREVAEPRGVPLSQVALAWVLRNPVVSTALVGARTPAEVDANVAGAELQLSDDDVARIEQIVCGAAGRVNEFTPLRVPIEQWGEELPVGR